MGTLFVVATPIGNLSDLTIRAKETLADADHILAEDTRRAKILLRHIEVATRPTSLHAHNEASRTETVCAWLDQGKRVALVSDAGMPLLSDPGERTVRAVLDAGHDVVPVPGPSAILAGLVASGLPCVPFTFVGFLPRKAGKRKRALDRIVEAEETTVVFESPERLVRLLDDLEGRMGAGRRVAVCRELTKLHEEVFRGTPAMAARYYRETAPRGEITVVIEGMGQGGAALDAGEAEALAARLLAEGLTPTAVARSVARRAGVPRREAYGMVQRVKDRGGRGTEA